MKQKTKWTTGSRIESMKNFEKGTRRKNSEKQFR